jgi:hypothetical protein
MKNLQQSLLPYAIAFSIKGYINISKFTTLCDNMLHGWEQDLNEEFAAKFTSICDSIFNKGVY